MIFFEEARTCFVNVGEYESCWLICSVVFVIIGRYLMVCRRSFAQIRWPYCRDWELTVYSMDLWLRKASDRRLQIRERSWGDSLVLCYWTEHRRLVEWFIISILFSAACWRLCREEIYIHSPNRTHRPWDISAWLLIRLVICDLVSRLVCITVVWCVDVSYVCRRSFKTTCLILLSNWLNLGLRDWPQLPSPNQLGRCWVFADT